MKNTIFFKQLTYKIYNSIMKNAEELDNKKETHPSDYDIAINREKFTDVEWNFLDENEDKFTF